MYFRIKDTSLRIIRGDITHQETEAIVNAANSSLMGGGGVDGAIHRAGGPKIMEECKKIRKEDWPDGLPPGEAVITSGGNLRARFVIYTVGPIWTGGERESETLQSCYLKSLMLAENRGIRSISFPSIGTGAYGYPVNLASKIAIQSVKDYILEEPTYISEIRFVLFSSHDLEIYLKEAAEIIGG